jgi:hypothetical protein
VHIIPIGIRSITVDTSFAGSTLNVYSGDHLERYIIHHFWALARPYSKKRKKERRKKYPLPTVGLEPTIFAYALLR